MVSFQMWLKDQIDVDSKFGFAPFPGKLKVSKLLFINQGGSKINKTNLRKRIKYG